LLGEFHPVLLLAARRHINPRLTHRCDPLDAVQQALAVAVASFGRFRGQTPLELKAWLFAIQRSILTDVFRRHVLAHRRSIDREVPRPTYSHTAGGGCVALATDSTPSRRFVRRETAFRLEQLLEELPIDQREAMRLHYLEERKVWEVAEEMQSSVTTVAGLVKRAMRTLRNRMNESSWW
jgi:RNA polymerase sigma-70 factor (ECF subfamily)